MKLRSCCNGFMDRALLIRALGFEWYVRAFCVQDTDRAIDGKPWIDLWGNGE